MSRPCERPGCPGSASSKRRKFCNPMCGAYMDDVLKLQEWAGREDLDPESRERLSMAWEMLGEFEPVLDTYASFRGVR